MHVHGKGVASGSVSQLKVSVLLRPSLQMLSPQAPRTLFQPVHPLLPHTAVRQRDYSIPACAPTPPHTAVRQRDAPFSNESCSLAGIPNPNHTTQVRLAPSQCCVSACSRRAAQRGTEEESQDSAARDGGRVGSTMCILRTQSTQRRRDGEGVPCVFYAHNQRKGVEMEEEHHVYAK